MNKNKLKTLIEEVVKEEFGGLLGSFFYGKDRNGGNKNPPEWQKGQNQFDSFVEEFKSLVPEFKNHGDYRRARQLAKSLDTNEVGASFKVYDILWPILKAEGWSGEEDDASAAMAVFQTLRQ